MHDCSLDVAQGEILVLMGLSGSGKSTLLRAVNGLNPVARGQVTIHDGDWTAEVVGAASADLLRIRRECVAMVFQQFGLLPWRTVRDNVGLGLELGGMAKAERHAKVDEQLALVGLTDWAEQQGRRAVGRHAAARRPCARLRHRRADPADGRALLGARPADPRPAPGRA